MKSRPQIDLGPLRKIGFDLWDPIGGGVPEDEYDTYLLKAAGHLWNGDALDQVAEYLVAVEAEWMGLGHAPGTKERALQVATAISRYVESLRA